jgi:hypothetical protein
VRQAQLVLLSVPQELLVALEQKLQLEFHQHLRREVPLPRALHRR